MTSTFNRKTFDAWWECVNAQAQTNKNSQSALLELMAKYRAASTFEREILNQVFCEWVNSEEDIKRFDGFAMVDEFVILDCIPYLVRRREHLAASTTPEAPYERAKIERILTRLNSGDERRDHET